MVDIDRIVRGVMRYLDREVLDKMGWQRWVLGTGVSLYAKNAREIFEEWKDKEVIRMLGVVDGDMIDLDKLHKELMEQARKGAITIDLPAGLGRVTLSDHDVDLMHNYIINA